MTGANAGTKVDVSVIVAAWKAADVIGRAAASALASTGVTVEVIIVDDASPDATFATASLLAATDLRIIVDRLPVNSGPSVARNRAIELARGEFVAVLDADDTMKPCRLASLIAQMRATGADIGLDNMIDVDEEGRSLGEKPFLKSDAFARDREIDLASWAWYNQPTGGTDSAGYLKPVIRRAKLVDTSTSYDNGLRNSEDYYLLAHLLALGARMTYRAEPGYLYTRSSSSTSYRLKPANTRSILDAEIRFQSLFNGRFSEAETKALARRKRTLRNLDQFVGTVEAIKTRKIGAALGLLASDLRATAFTLGTLGKVALGKVLRRKLV
jgi:succinoglycan biosynthesis protein ExoO